jgi:hypothetical protein
MFGPPVLHEPFWYLTGFHGKILKDRGITGKSQLSQLWKMLTPFPREHLENTNESIAINILIALRKGGRHHRNLRPKPLKKVRQKHAGGELCTPSTERSH